MPDASLQLFNNTDVPKKIGAACCGQFAVSREQVLKKPLSDYRHYLDWLINTALNDDTSGRVLEHLWHIIFGRDPVQYVYAPVDPINPGIRLTDMQVVLRWSNAIVTSTDNVNRTSCSSVLLY
jgi:hypothetical protein